MGSLTLTQIQQLCDFRADIIAAFQADLSNAQNIDAVASGALDLTKPTSELTVAGTKAFTIAAPTFVGQRKIVRCVAASATPLGTLTVTSPDTTTGYVCPATFLFDTAGQEVVLEATAGLLWRAITVKRAGGSANNIVVGTTLQTAMALWKFVGLSVTGTVSSTGTKAFAPGAAVGERVVVAVTTAASTPVGSIDVTGRSIAGAAFTHMGGLDATTDTAELEWDGAAWQIMYSTGLTLT